MAKKFGSRHSAGREGGREEGSWSADEGKIYIGGVTKLRRQGGGHRRLKRPTTSGEMTLGPRHEARGPQRSVFRPRLGCWGTEREGGEEEGFSTNTVECSTWEEDLSLNPISEVRKPCCGGASSEKSTCDCDSLVEERTGHFMASSSHCDAD